jgi:hypothetical protein
MTNSSVQATLGTSVVELTFVRRHEKLGWNNIRGLLGTTNYNLLNGEFGHSVLHFQPPKGAGMGYNYKSKNLCVVWDFFRQEYRVFGAEQVNIRKVFDLTEEDSEKEFYTWFYDYIINMSEQQKLDFMGYEGEAYAAKQQAERQRRQIQSAPVPVQKPVQVPITQRIKNVYQNVKGYLNKFLGRKKS